MFYASARKRKQQIDRYEKSLMKTMQSNTARDTQKIIVAGKKMERDLSSSENK